MYRRGVEPICVDVVLVMYVVGRACSRGLVCLVQCSWVAWATAAMACPREPLSSPHFPRAWLGLFRLFVATLAAYHSCVFGCRGACAVQVQVDHMRRFLTQPRPVWATRAWLARPPRPWFNALPLRTPP